MSNWSGETLSERTAAERTSITNETFGGVGKLTVNAGYAAHSSGTPPVWQLQSARSVKRARRRTRSGIKKRRPVARAPYAFVTLKKEPPRPQRPPRPFKISADSAVSAVSSDRDH